MQFLYLLLTSLTCPCADILRAAIGKGAPMYNRCRHSPDQLFVFPFSLLSFLLLRCPESTRCTLGMSFRGDIKGCAKLYQQAAEKALPRASVPGVQQRLKQGLQV
jgi:hypothetical protein